MAAMEFWGVEVKPGKPLKCEAGENGEERYLHISQVSLGEVNVEKANENVLLYVTVSGKKLVLGTLSADKCRQFSCDVVFDNEFELSHSSKDASVHVIGYRMSGNGPEDDSDRMSESESDDNLQIAGNANGKPIVKNEQAKPVAGKPTVAKPHVSAAKSNVKADILPKKEKVKTEEDEDESDDDSDEAESDDEDESDEDEEMGVGEDDSDDDEDESEEEEATPKKPETGKKRANDSDTKTPVPVKKAKVVTPAGQKTGGDAKKTGHVATPYPSKQAGKTPGNSDKGKQKTPQSGGGAFNCKLCNNRPFTSESALQSHTKAKHSK